MGVLEIWTVDGTRHAYDLEGNWKVAYDESPFGENAALAVAHQENRRVLVFPWSSIVKISYPNVGELRDLLNQEPS